MQSKPSFAILVALVVSIAGRGGFSTSEAAPRTAQYAAIDYDVVYVRCPRGKEPVFRPDQKNTKLLNWNGVNDLWLSASNNIYQQPGCDLVLHHSAPHYKDLPLGSPGREEVLVNCDESDDSKPVCTIADPNVSLDGTSIVYAKFLDTRHILKDFGVYGDGGWGGQGQTQSQMVIDPAGKGGRYARRLGGSLNPYDAPALIYKYDLKTHRETQVSPKPEFFSGRAHPGKPEDWHSNIPVMDTAPFYITNDRIGFTSNRESGFLRFELMTMDLDGRNLEFIGHRTMAEQLHPSMLMDGRIMYTSKDVMLEKPENNNYSLFTINPDGAFPFILAGKHDSTHLTYHYSTQLSDGDIVAAIYYNHNNNGLGSLLRFPVDPPGADFVHLQGRLKHFKPFDGQWHAGKSLFPFSKPDQYLLAPEARSGDGQAPPYKPSEYWRHPADGRTVTMNGRYTHPAAAPNNDLLVTYAIGGGSTMPNKAFKDLAKTREMIGKDAGVWLIPLKPHGARRLGNISVDGRIVVDFPQYHEIMPRAVVPYQRSYGIPRPGVDREGRPTKYARVTPNFGTLDARLSAGAPFGLSGASSLYDRETRSINGTPWNMQDGGGVMSGRTYLNLAASGAELAIFDNNEIYGIRVLMPVPPVPNNYPGGLEQWAGIQRHHLRILGEYPVRKPDGTPLDKQGNPDTSFVVRLPANTPFLFQTLDKRGMALDIETTSRTVARGERQFCSGCHVHTREGMDPYQSLAVKETDKFADFTAASAPLFDGFDAAGGVTVKPARDIYRSLPGVRARHSFAVDWRNGISALIQKRCARCHGEGQPAQQRTGLRLDGDDRTYELLVNNQYIREDGKKIDFKTKPGDGLKDVIADTPGTDRITKTYSCCIASRWLAINSARSSMLIWALYGERLDGRDPKTGLPPAGSGVLVDTRHREHPAVWPKVAEHAAYVKDMPESEKRLIARWIDLGAPKVNVHDDLMRPVLTLTPLLEGRQIKRVLVGLWDDSALDYRRFSVRHNGKPIMNGEAIKGAPTVVAVDLPIPITRDNQDQEHYTFEIWDKPDRSLSLVQPGVAAANRTRRAVTGRGLFRLVSDNKEMPSRYHP